MEAIFAALPKIIPIAAFPVVFMFILMVIFIGWKTVGLKPTLKAIGIGTIVAYVLEEIGVHTGIIFGRYYFNEICGPKLDVIPIAWPFGWVGILYLAWVIANLILDGAPLPTSYSHSRILIGGVMSALIASTLDVTMDPFCVSHGGWVWLDGGRFFGVPYHNWVGWFIVGFISMTLHGYILRAEQDTLVQLEKQPKWIRLLSVVPVLFFAFTAFGLILINFDGILGLVSVYLFGIPIIAALWRFTKWYQHTVEHPKDSAN